MIIRVDNRLDESRRPPKWKPTNLSIDDGQGGILKVGEHTYYTHAAALRVTQGVRDYSLPTRHDIEADLSRGKEAPEHKWPRAGYYKAPGDGPYDVTDGAYWTCHTAQGQCRAFTISKEGVVTFPRRDASCYLMVRLAYSGD